MLGFTNWPPLDTPKCLLPGKCRREKTLEAPPGWQGWERVVVPQLLPLVRSPKGRSLPRHLEIYSWRFWPPQYMAGLQGSPGPHPGTPRPHPKQSARRLPEQTLPRKPELGSQESSPFKKGLSWGIWVAQWLSVCLWLWSGSRGPGIESRIRLPAWRLLLPLPVSLPLSVCLS